VLAQNCNDMSDAYDTDPPFLVKLPPELAAFYKESGYLPASYWEARVNARLRVRCESTLTSVFIPAFALEQHRRARVLVKDLSRAGIGILSHQQMWPTETFVLVLKGRSLACTVARCRKLGKLCFEVGARIDSLEHRKNPSELAESQAP
jgi:hypothetical protein